MEKLLSLKGFQCICRHDNVFASSYITSTGDAIFFVIYFLIFEEARFLVKCEALFGF